MQVLVTGGAGFIGSCFVRHMLKAHPDYDIVNLDALTYAGNLENLKDVEDNPHYRFVKGDICDSKLCHELIKDCQYVVNFAAESHVDRSILNPQAFVDT
ncbi:MAG: GDP-mannose 4,6-dehydratase, partial [Succinivibrio sp.]|nr:GDP-mannose 4,6-dehydratase [Succinivibrio sp.]